MEESCRRALWEFNYSKVLQKESKILQEGNWAIHGYVEGIVGRIMPYILNNGDEKITPLLGTLMVV